MLYARDCANDLKNGISSSWTRSSSAASGMADTWCSVSIVRTSHITGPADRPGWCHQELSVVYTVSLLRLPEFVATEK